jgi:hypothetical protein
MKKNRFLDAEPKEWEDYRKKYNWKPQITSENPAFKLFESNISYYNAEEEVILRSWIDKIPSRERAVPKELNFIWETAKGEQFIGRAYFNWERLNSEFEKAGKDFQLDFKVAKDNSSFDISINNQPIKADSIRIFRTEREFHDSYQ